MSLTAGTKLGPYEIVAPLGAGGMGEVYRARDTRLGRDVAIKVLPQHLSASVEVRARFEREARTVSSLNHPHICTLHDVGREGDVDYLVMELVEGETLADRLVRGALPLDEVLRFGAQIADALDRAHRAGVLHRDLKPGNVMLTRSGAKLMDFGLARPTELGGPASASALTALPSADSPTRAKPLTAEGTLVGTFHYMAPEQLEGKKSDVRADLWALGCVLYEMATGRRAFDGRSQASLIGAIMSSTPVPISQVAALAPLALDQVVRACLTRDPEERIQTAHDVKLQLEWIGSAGSQTALPAPTVPRPRHRERLAWLVAAAGLALAAVSLYLLLSRQRDLDPILTSVEPGVKDIPLFASAVRISPDGKSIAFIGNDTAGSGIWIRALGADRPRLLPGTADVDVTMFWSPDGRYLAYGTSGKLKKVAIDGGSPVTVCDLEWARGGTWGTEGDIVFAAAPEGPLSRVPADGGQPSQLTRLDPARDEKSHRFPSFLPDGKRFLFVALPGGPEGYDTFVGSLDAGPVKKVLTAASAAVYAEPGYLLFAREGKIVAQRFDTERLELQGAPVAIGDAPAKTEVDAEPVASASRDLRLVYLRRQLPDTHLEWLDRGGDTLSRVPLPPGPWTVMSVSPDARKAAVINDTDVWVVDLTRAIPTRFVRTTTRELSLAWFHDSRRAAFVSNRSGRAEIYIGSTEAGGEPELLATTDSQFKWCSDITPDDRTLVFAALGEATSWDLWTIPTAGGKPEPYLVTPARETDGQVSPDGRWLAYESGESGQQEIYIQSFPRPGRRVRVSVDGGDGPAWTRGGRELIYGTEEGVVSVAIGAGTDIEPGIPRLLFVPLEGVTGGAVTGDGDRFLVSRGPRVEPDFMLVLDWTALVGR